MHTEMLSITRAIQILWGEGGDARRGNSKLHIQIFCRKKKPCRDLNSFLVEKEELTTKDAPFFAGEKCDMQKLFNVDWLNLLLGLKKIDVLNTYNDRIDPTWEGILSMYIIFVVVVLVHGITGPGIVFVVYLFYAPGSLTSKPKPDPGISLGSLTLAGCLCFEKVFKH